MSLGMGEGAELQAPLARVVIGGLTASTLVTLVLVPAVYTLFEEGLRTATAAERREREPDLRSEPNEPTDMKKLIAFVVHSGGGGAAAYYYCVVRQGRREADGQPQRRSRRATSSRPSARPARSSRCRPSTSARRCPASSQKIYADFNAIVKKGQLARGDRSRAAPGAGGHPESEHRAAARATSPTRKCSSRTGQKQLERTQQPVEKGLQNQQQLEAAELAVKIARGADRLGRRQPRSRTKANLDAGAS